MSMNRFIGRREELATLDRIYREENHKTCMVYGRRRIGKTRLLREFTKDKRSIYIDFVKVQTGLNTKSGWLGEVSTEVVDVIDYNLVK